MSTISTIYDEFNTLMTTLYPNKRELADAIDITNNDRISLRDGYAIYFGAGVNTQRQVGCKLSIERQVDITLTKVIEGSPKSLTPIETAEKALLEDAYTLINRLELNTTEISASKVYYTNDNGIQRVLAEHFNLITMELSFLVEYFENLTP